MACTVLRTAAARAAKATRFGTLAPGAFACFAARTLHVPRTTNQRVRARKLTQRQRFGQLARIECLQHTIQPHRRGSHFRTRHGQVRLLDVLFKDTRICCDGVYVCPSLHVNIFQVIDASLRERAHGAYRRLILGSIFNLLKEEDFPC